MAIEVKSTLDGTTKEVNPNAAYLVDFSKMNSVNDLMMVLSSFGFSVQGNHPFIEQLKPFLNLENPIIVEAPKKPGFIPLENTELGERIFDKEK